MSFYRPKPSSLARLFSPPALARWCASHPWLTLISWIVIIAGYAFSGPYEDVKLKAK